MKLRSNLLLVPPDSAKIERIRSIAERILNSIHSGNDPAKDIELIKEISGRDHYDVDYFESLHSHSSIDEFAAEASLPVPVRVSDITREELIEIIRLAKDSKWPNDLYYSALFDLNVPMPGASNLLYYPENWKSGQEISKYDPSPEEIVERATDPSNIIAL